MLFNYRYVPHSIETFQTWLDHLVKEVWCKAAGDFSVDLLDNGLKEVVLAIADDNRTKLKLFEPIRDLFNLFKCLSAEERTQFVQWYDANNDIKALCSNSPAHNPVTYAELAAINETLALQLKAFHSDLWERVLGLQPVKSKIGAIEAHYKEFVLENDEDKCPYCGYGDIKGKHLSKREAYDHYLPKGVYPFNSVNFKNLAPMCHECNSTYKLAKDPIRDSATGLRRKAFYSYDTASSGITIALTLNTANIDNLGKDDIAVTVIAPGRDEEVESWKRVFGIEDRYKAKCCGKNDGKAWLQQIIEECANHGQSRELLLQQVYRAADRSPYDNANFLKKPFLTACRKAHIV